MMKNEEEEVGDEDSFELFFRSNLSDHPQIDEKFEAFVHFFSVDGIGDRFPRFVKVFL